MADDLSNSVAQLASDLHAQKLYYVGTSALWVYDYFLTLGDEVKYAYAGRKNCRMPSLTHPKNRYFAAVTILLSLLSYFLDAWTLEVYVKTFVTTHPVYAVTGKHKAIPMLAILLIIVQCGLTVYIMSQASKSTDLPALLLSRRDASPLPPLPTLPNIDPFHICMFISTLTVKPWVEAALCTCLGFDIVVFVIITFATTKAIRKSHVGDMFRVIQRDGILYFFVLFASNMVFLLLVLHARPGLKFMHNHISSIMVNRITLNLKRASHKRSVIGWSVETFEDRSEGLHGPLLAPSEASYELRELRIDAANPPVL
ncbi:hypothetical protein EVG20_g4601 [Dentipellis fragilis]|uniref:Uncharacterized protein n=1 Tax=Dentipellis fragilis TaxID=205917 RepID=A0A4Y9YZD1_9AGAM|nr:hypothetical protein EVG20_g4601 [Dentipellis fragilis]